MIGTPVPASISSIRAGEEPGEVVLAIETRLGSSSERLLFRLDQKSIDLLADALVLIRDGSIEKLEADDHDNDGWAI